MEEIFDLSKKTGKQFFRMILESSCKHKIIKIDMKNENDKRIIDFISKAMRNFMNYTKKAGYEIYG